MKYILLILSCILLTACATRPSSGGVVEIVGSRDGVQIVRGMGVCIDDSTILTSAHVVRDDRINYGVGGMRYEVGERDFSTDIAYMRQGDTAVSTKNQKPKTKNDICSNPKLYIGKVKLKVGDMIYIPVVRSGSLMTITGTLTSLTGTILAYDTLGRTQLMTGVLMTDITTQPGDSGAPILDKEGRVVDVVHVQ